MEKKSDMVVALDKNEVSCENGYRKESGLTDSNYDILELVTSHEEKDQKIDGVVIGKLAGFADSGEPMVDFSLNYLNRPLLARSNVVLNKNQIGMEVTIMFEMGNPLKPIIIGIIQHPEKERSVNADVKLDKERIVFTAKKEIVLRCGKASITLTRAGKILIHGAYLLNRSSGVNKIKGGSVQIN